MEKVDRTHWERAELFEFFSAVSHPFYSVTFRVDVTNLYRYVKAVSYTHLTLPTT